MFEKILTSFLMRRESIRQAENAETTHKSFAFATKNQLPFFYVSASNGTNVVKMFREAIASAVRYRKNPTDVGDQILDELESIP